MKNYTPDYSGPVSFLFQWVIQNHRLTLFNGVKTNGGTGVDSFSNSLF